MTHVSRSLNLPTYCTYNETLKRIRRHVRALKQVRRNQATFIAGDFARGKNDDIPLSLYPSAAEFWEWHSACAATGKGTRGGLMTTLLYEYPIGKRQSVPVGEIEPSKCSSYVPSWSLVGKDAAGSKRGQATSNFSANLRSTKVPFSPLVEQRRQPASDFRRADQTRRSPFSVASRPSGGSWTNRCHRCERLSRRFSPFINFPPHQRSCAGVW